VEDEMKPTLTITKKSQSNLDIDFNPEALSLPEDEFVALLEDSIKLLQSQILLIQESG
jgi:hypothetical protein